MNRKQYLLATAGSVAGSVAVATAGSAQAADMPLKAPPPPVAAPSWAGWYIGVNAGAAWQRMSDDPASSYGTTVVGTGAATRTHGTSFIGGGQIGYNWQTGNYVYGLEGDFSGLSGNGNSGIGSNIKGTSIRGSSTKMNWLSTVRGRLGATFNTDSLLYVTGGVAFANVRNTFNFGDTGALPFVNNKSVTKTLTGWTVGGGIEHMITPHWIVGAEVLYVGLPHSNVIQNNGQGTKTTTFSNSAVIARARLNYKF